MGEMREEDGRGEWNEPTDLKQIWTIGTKQVA